MQAGAKDTKQTLKQEKASLVSAQLVECFPSMYSAMGLIPSTTEN